MSKKILLVYDDYTEMIRVQTDLMKVGFDVIGIVNEVLLADQLVSFHPDVVITAGRGGKVSAPSVAHKIKELTSFRGKIIVLLPPTQRLSPDELAKIRMDALLEIPVTTDRLLHSITKVLNLEAGLRGKFQKLRQGEAPEDFHSAITGVPMSLQPQAGLPARKGPPKSREERMAEALASAKIDTHKTEFDRKKIKDRQEQLKKDWDSQELEKLDELKRQFAEALFKKK